MTKYTVLTALHHDNRAYAVGDEVELTDEQAKNLLILHCIDPLPAPKKSTKPNPDK